MSKKLAETGQVDKLMEAARHPEGPTANEVGLAESARNLASAGHVDEGLTLARMTKIPIWRAYALGGVSEALGQDGKTEKAGALADEALQTSLEVKKEPDRSYTFDWVVRALAESGKWSEALRVTEDIQDKTSHDQALMDIAERLAKSGRTADAFTVAKQARDPNLERLVFGTIVVALARAGKGQEAADTLLRLKRQGLVAINALGWPVDLATVVEFVAEQRPSDALTLAHQVNDAGQRRHMLATVAEALVRAGRSDEARQAALEALAENRDKRQAGDDRVLSSRADDFATIMFVLGNTGMSRQAQKAGNQALATAEIIPDDTKKSGAFLTVATAFARIHSYRQARLTGERCTSSGDKLSASAAILREYTIQHHPELAKLFAETSR
jgi:tetratricopeptide (TPR) repeat protein